jgi:hypothetical protein
MGTGSTQHRADNSRRIGDTPLGRKQGSGGERPISPPATGPDTERRSAGRPAPRSRPSRTSDRDGPEPGHLMRRRARRTRRPVRGLDRRSQTEPECWQGRGWRLWIPLLWARASPPFSPALPGPNRCVPRNLDHAGNGTIFPLRRSSSDARPRRGRDWRESLR